VIAAAIPFRGLNLWALWQVEVAEKFAAWQGSGDDELMRIAFTNGGGVLPTIPRFVATFFDDPLLGVRATALCAVAAVVASVFVLVASRVGRRAATLAVVALCLTPRFWAAATVPSATIFATAAVLLVWVTALAARDDWRWAPVSLFAMTLGLGTHPVVWLFLIPLAWVALVKPGSIGGGMVSIRSVGLWILVLPVLAVMLLVIGNEYYHEDTALRLGEALSLWLERPTEPFLYAGARMGHARLLPHVPIKLLAITIPAGLVVAAMGGAFALRGLSPSSRHDLWAFGSFALLAAFLLRSPYFGGADLLLLGAVFVAMLAGIGLDFAYRALVSRFGDGIAAVLIASVFLLSAADVARCGMNFESYYSGAIGGTSGAVQRGYSRYAHAPVPVAELRSLNQSGVNKLAIMTNGWEMRPVIERYRDLGVVGPEFELVELMEAQAIVVHFDDSLPELYSVIRDVGLFAAGSPESTLVVGSPEMPLFLFGRISH
jgi:hypothetical protein